MLHHSLIDPIIHLKLARLKTGLALDLHEIIYNRGFIWDMNASARTEKVNFSTVNFWEPFGVFFIVADFISPIEGTKPTSFLQLWYIDSFWPVVVLNDIYRA